MRVLFPFHRKRKTRTEQTHLPFTAQIDMHATDVEKEISNGYQRKLPSSNIMNRRIKRLIGKIQVSNIQKTLR